MKELNKEEACQCVPKGYSKRFIHDDCFHDCHGSDRKCSFLKELIIGLTKARSLVSVAR